MRRADCAGTLAAAAAIAAGLFLLASCASRDMAGTARRQAGRGDRVPGAKSFPVTRDSVAASAAPYDIEGEMPEKMPQRSAQLIEKLEPVASDTFSVQDIEMVEKPKQLYDIGYRVQVFASGDRAAAEKVRQRVVAETGMSAYIEFEEALYKVRAGDFTERKDAAQAGSKLAGAYPGCWIVRTTIRKSP